MKSGEVVEKIWKCMICLRRFCFVKGAARHNLKVHNDQSRFEDVKVFGRF